VKDELVEPFGFLHQVGTALDCPSSADVFFGDWGGCQVVTTGNVQQETGLAYWPGVTSDPDARIRVVAYGSLPGGESCVTWKWNVRANVSGNYPPDELLVADDPGGCFTIVAEPWRPEWTPRLIIRRNDRGTVEIAMQTFMGRGRETYAVEGQATLQTTEYK
jgi:hypothetical protein